MHPIASLLHGHNAGEADSCYCRRKMAADLSRRLPTIHSQGESLYARVESSDRGHQLAHLDSLAVYFNTDSKTLGGLEYTESKNLFREQVRRILCSFTAGS